MNLVVDQLAIKPTSLTIYGYYLGDRVQTKKVTDLDNKPNGVLSSKARRRLVNSCQWLYLLNHRANINNDKHNRLVFITLTLPSKQIHSDLEIKKKCLNQFLVEICKTKGVEMYVWRAEKQENGNIHFHLIVDRYIDKTYLQNTWNRIVNKLSYVDRCSTDNPPSTNVQAVKSVKMLTNYLSKYVAKEVNEKEKYKVEGRLWFVSSELSKMRGLSIDLNEEIQKELQQLSMHANAELLRDEEAGYTSIMIDFNHWYGKYNYLTTVINHYLDVVLDKRPVDEFLYLYPGPHQKEKPEPFIDLGFSVKPIENQLKLFN